MQLLPAGAATVFKPQSTHTSHEGRTSYCRTCHSQSSGNTAFGLQGVHRHQIVTCDSRERSYVSANLAQLVRQCPESALNRVHLAWRAGCFASISPAHHEGGAAGGKQSALTQAGRAIHLMPRLQCRAGIWLQGLLSPLYQTLLGALDVLGRCLMMPASLSCCSLTLATAAGLAHTLYMCRAVKRAVTSCKGRARGQWQPLLHRKGKKGSEMMAGNRTLSGSNNTKALGMVSLLR